MVAWTAFRPVVPVVPSKAPTQKPGDVRVHPAWYLPAEQLAHVTAVLLVHTRHVFLQFLRRRVPRFGAAHATVVRSAD